MSPEILAIRWNGRRFSHVHLESFLGLIWNKITLFSNAFLVNWMWTAANVHYLQWEMLQMRTRGILVTRKGQLLRDSAQLWILPTPYTCSLCDYPYLCMVCNSKVLKITLEKSFSPCVLKSEIQQFWRHRVVFHIWYCSSYGFGLRPRSKVRFCHYFLCDLEQHRKCRSPVSSSVCVMVLPSEASEDCMR